MSDDTPYIPRSAGDLITAEDWSDLQVFVKKDLAQRLADLEQKIKTAGVDHAADADEFAGRTGDQWTSELDGRYAPKVHDHEGTTAYRRYVKRFTPDAGFDKILLPHKLGRYPLVDAYRLLPVVNSTDPRAAEFADCTLFFYYGGDEADTYGLWAIAYRDRVPLGLRFGPLLAELKVAYTDDTTLEDLLNDFWEALARDPNDRLPHCHSPWTTECCERRRTVRHLKSSGQWDDLYLAVKPRKVALDTTAGDGGTDAGTVVITQADYDTLLVEVTRFPTEGETRKPLDLMFVLRS